MRQRLWPSACALCALLLAHLAHAQEGAGTSATTSVYVRTDTDKTTVVTPRVRLGAEIAEETQLGLVYTVDVWTSASIDIRTAASKRVTEQRDEIDVSLTHAFTDLTAGASYRYSTENDYESNGGSIDLSYDFADNNANLSLAARAYFDRVGDVNVPSFEEPVSTLNARASFTQVLDADTYLQVIYEISQNQGFLSSPYRWVRIANEVGFMPSTCRQQVLRFADGTVVDDPVDGCYRENNPDQRLRHAAALYVRRALGSSLSAGGSYRFYFDDWDIMSSTVNLDAAWVPDHGWLLALAYRFYDQSAASFYKPFYRLMPFPTYFTSDKELTSFSAHRVSLELSRNFETDGGTELRTVLLAAPTYYSYRDFWPLDHILAVELTLALEVTL